MMVCFFVFLAMIPVCLSQYPEEAGIPRGELRRYMRDLEVMFVRGRSNAWHRKMYYKLGLAVRQAGVRCAHMTTTHCTDSDKPTPPANVNPVEECSQDMLKKICCNSGTCGNKACWWILKASLKEKRSGVLIRETISGDATNPGVKMNEDFSANRVRMVPATRYFCGYVPTYIRRTRTDKLKLSVALDQPETWKKQQAGIGQPNYDPVLEHHGMDDETPAAVNIDILLWHKYMKKKTVFNHHITRVVNKLNNKCELAYVQVEVEVKLVGRCVSYLLPAPTGANSGSTRETKLACDTDLPFRWRAYMFKNETFYPGSSPPRRPPQ